MNPTFNIQYYLQRAKRLCCFLLLIFLSYQANSQVVDTILMTVETFKGDDNVASEFTRQQIAKILSSQLTDYIIPVLNIEDQSRVVKLRTKYKTIAQNTDEPFSKYPDYICDGIITKNFITVNITRSQNEEIFLSANVERKKNGKFIQKDVRKLADELVETLVEKIYDVNFGQRSRMILRTNPKDRLEIIQSGNVLKDGQKTIELSEGARILNIKVTSVSGISVEENVELKPRSLLFASIKKQKQTIKIKRLKNKAEVRIMLFLNDNYLSQLSEFSLKREIGGNFSLGIGLGTGLLSYEHSLPIFNDLEPIITQEKKQFYSYNLLLDYERFFSKSDIIISSELGVSPFLKGGHLQTAISWASLHWISFEVGVRNYAINIDRYQFEPYQSSAEQITKEERFTFLTLGLRLKHNF